MKRLEVLTKAQGARMAEWADEWIARGLKTGETDWEAFERGVRACYRHAGLAEPRVIVRCPSPLVVAFAGPIAARILGGGAVRVAVDDAVHGAVRDAVHDAVGVAVDGAVHVAVDGAVRGAVDDAVRGAVGVAVHGAVGGAVGVAVGVAVHGAVGVAVDGAVHDAVRGAVDGAVDGAVRGAVDDAVRSGWHGYLGGQFWLSWQAYTSFFRDVCGLELPGDLWQRDRDYALAQQSACWWWPHKQSVMVSARPSVIHREQVGPRGWGSHRLHCDTGPAIAWDGFSIYAIHGVRVPAWLVETEAENLDPLLFAQQENVEVRREFVRKIGVERLCAKLGTKILDKRDDYELHLVDLGGETGPWPYLKMRNPSIGVYHMEAVSKECRTVEQALNFRNGGEIEHIAPIT